MCSLLTSGKSDLIVIEDGKSGYAYESNVSHALTKESSGGCFPNCETWWKNSQFILNVNVTGEILIVLDNDSQALDSIPIGFAIFKTDNDHAITISSPGQHLKTSAGLIWTAQLSIFWFYQFFVVSHKITHDRTTKLHGRSTKITKKTKQGNLYNDRSTLKNDNQKHDVLK